MLNFKKYAVLAGSLLLVTLSLPKESSAQTTVTIPPSKVTAGTASGGGTNGSSNTNFSVPVNATGNAITPASPQITFVLQPDGSLAITIPPAVTQAVNTAGTNLQLTFATGSLSQQQIAVLVSALPAIVNSLNGGVPGTVVLQPLQGNSNQPAGAPQVFTTLGDAFVALQTQFINANTQRAFSLSVGDVKVTLRPSTPGGQ